MSFLQLSGKRFLVMGLGNRKSVAWVLGQTLEAEGATVVYGVRNAQRRDELAKLLKDRPTVLCDVEHEADLQALPAQLEAYGPLDGFVHSIAFANYSEGFVPFHETNRQDFLQATQVSSFSLVELSRVLKPLLQPQASVVAIGISSYVTAPTYGYMSPIKSALEGSVRFLAKSFSADTEVRFNTVNAGPLKTKSSAGIPNYLNNYLFAEKLTMRKRALTTQEVADTAAYLLSPRSSGINAQGITVNAGMDWNYFDEEVVRLAMRPE
ncbi:MAG: enoyl-acyl-carrier protein reductase I [Puniceicoccaceae bacterium 5H]|nr:MAG: enoyl-acyl-carrier protein reductase I [Puniceicoccaceae bacterium 5H]